MTNFIFLYSKITVDGDCNYEIKTLTPWKKSKDKQCIKRQRHYFAEKGLHSQTMIFPAAMNGYKKWTTSLSAKKLMLSNCGVGEDSKESLGL